ncbi:DUF1330 domain-containing protein [bacterium]|nr:DUF1330 domain-containing protein [bacterium]
MHVVNQVFPTPEQIMPLAGDDSGPVVMLNLLKFRDRAVYRDGRADDCTGREAFLRYAALMQRIVERAGGRFLFSGEVQGIVIGRVDEPWDLIGLVEYPSRAAFFRIATSAEVQEIGVHREAGLAGQILIPLTPLRDPV